MTEDPKKNEPASKGQGAAGTKKDGPPGASRQQASQSAAEAKSAPEKAKGAAAPPGASPPSPDRDPGKDAGKDSGKEGFKDSPSGEKGVTRVSPPAAPLSAPQGAPVSAPQGGPVSAPQGAPGAAPARSPVDSAAAGPAPQPTTSAPPEKPAPEAPVKPEAPDKPKPEAPAKPQPEAAAKSAAGPSRPAAEPWKPAPEPAAAATADRPDSARPDSARPDPARPDSARPDSEKTPGEGPAVPRPGGPEGKSPQPPAQPPPKRRQGCLALIAVLVILVVGGILTWPYWSPAVAPFVQDYLPARPADEQTASLESRVADLDQRVQQAAVRQEDLAALQQDVEALREQMNALTGRPQDGEPGVAAMAPEWIDERFNEVRSEGQQLEQRVAALDEQIGGLNEQLTGLEEQVRGLGEQIAGFDQQQVTGVEEQVTGLEEQVQSLSQQIAATRDVTQDAAAVALGLSRLSETLGTSRPYRQELDAFKDAVNEAVLDDESLQPLESYAETGVPTFADLYRRFPEMADAVARAGVETNDDGPLQTTVNRLRSLVTVRRTGEAALEAGGSDAVLQVSRNRLEAGDLPGAIDALEQLEGASAEGARWWLDAARSRLAVQRAMERIHLRAIAMLSSKEG